MSFTSDPPRWRDVGVVSTAQLLGTLGTFLVLVTQILVFEQRGASGLEVAALVICEAVPMVVLGKPIGVLVDRVDSRLLLVAAGSMQAVACLALAYTTSLGATLGAILAFTTAGAVATSTQRALVPVMVRRDDLPRASAIGQTAGSVGMIAGPALAGLLVGGIGPQSTFRFASLGFLGVLVAALAVRTRRGGAAGRSPRVAAAAADRTATTGDRPDPGAAPTPSTGDQAWTLRSDPLLRTCVWSLTAVLAAASAVNVVLVFFVMGTLGSSPQAYGVIDAMWTVGVLVGAWLCGLGVRQRTGDTTVGQAMVAAIGLICVALIATATAQGPWWIVPCYLVGGAANGTINVFAATLIGRRAPSAVLGRANTAMAVRVQGGALVGYVGGGLLLAVGQPRWIVLGCGVVGLLVALAALPAVARSGTKVAPWASGTGSAGMAGTPTTAGAETVVTPRPAPAQAPASRQPAGPG